MINDIVARWPGSAHDSHIFDNSRIRARLENGEFGETVLLGDSGYPLRNYLITPIGTPEGGGEQLFNEGQIRTRTVIERLFGIWKRRFPVLSYGMRCKIPLAQDIILAAAILHNIARKENEPDNFDEVMVLNNDQIDEELLRNNQDHYIRRRFINYFTNL